MTASATPPRPTTLELPIAGMDCAGGCRLHLANRWRISTLPGSVLRSPISTACGKSCSNSAMKPSWRARAGALSDRCAIITASALSPSPNCASRAPRPGIRLGSG